MTKDQIIAVIKSRATGFLTYPASIQRRINDLYEMEIAAQEARESLEAVLFDLEDQVREPIGFGYYEGGRPYWSESEEYADRVSTCVITPLYTEEDKKNYLAGQR